MTTPFIIDAHVHLGTAGQIVSPGATVIDLLARMDRLGIGVAVGSDHTALLEGRGTGLARMQRAYEESAGRLRYLGVFDPRAPRECLRELEAAAGKQGFVGLKLHPPCHATAADDTSYRPAWEFALRHSLPVLAHSWSVSDYNPSQALATPGRFETWVWEFPGVALVLAHAGGRGTGRLEAVRMARECPNVYLDFAGDIYCRRLVEKLVAAAPADKILFGSDYPWTGPSDHLTRVLLAAISDDAKMAILCENAARVYKLTVNPC